MFDWLFTDDWFPKFDWRWDYAWEILPRLIEATGNTLIAAAAGYLIALVLGLAFALAQRSQSRVLTFSYASSSNLSAQPRFCCKSSLSSTWGRSLASRLAHGCRV